MGCDKYLCNLAYFGIQWRTYNLACEFYTDLVWFWKSHCFNISCSWLLDIVFLPPTPKVFALNIEHNIIYLYDCIPWVAVFLTIINIEVAIGQSDQKSTQLYEEGGGEGILPLDWPCQCNSAVWVWPWAFKHALNHPWNPAVHTWLQ